MHPQGYARHGKTRAGTIRLRCRAYDGVFTPMPRPAGAKRSPWLHEEYQMVQMLQEHIPIRRILGHTGVNYGRMYQLLRRVHGAVRTFQGHGDASAMHCRQDGFLSLSIDRQIFGVK